MKLLTNKLILAATLATACFSQQASAITILDTYEGANGHGLGDVIGSDDDFEIYSMDVSMNGNFLTVIINTNFGGKGDDGLFGSTTSHNLTDTTLSGGSGIGYGDLFLSSAWTPYNGIGDAPYAEDDHSNGTIWTYGFSLDDRWGAEDTTHNGTLYSLNAGVNNTDAYLAEDFLSGGTFRDGQEIAVDTSSGTAKDDVNSDGGTWATSDSANNITFVIDLTGATSLLNSSTIALHWGMTCGNDTIEGEFTKVPEPAILGLIGLGLLGMSFSKRKKA